MPMNLFFDGKGPCPYIETEWHLDVSLIIIAASKCRDKPSKINFMIGVSFYLVVVTFFFFRPHIVTTQKTIGSGYRDSAAPIHTLYWEVYGSVIILTGCRKRRPTRLNRSMNKKNTHVTAIGT